MPDQNTPKGGPTYERVQERLADLADMLAGAGAHADHTQKQVGQNVCCSCGVQAQGRLERRRST